MTNQTMQGAEGPRQSSWLGQPLSRLVLLSVGFWLASVSALAQATDPPPRTHTNDDFRVPRTLPVPPATTAPVVADMSSPASASNRLPGETATSTRETSRETPAVAGTPQETPFAELIARRDANGMWVLISQSLPAPGPEKLAPPALISTGKPELDAVIMEMASKYGVDPRLVVEVIRQESGFNPYAISPAGAKGLMQLIDATAARMGTHNVFDVRQNIEGGVKYLRLLLDMFNGDVALALAGYNAGEHRVIRSGYQVPNIPETRHYVKSILARYGKASHRVSKQKTDTAPVPDEPPPPPLRVFVQDGVVFLTNR